MAFRRGNKHGRGGPRPGGGRPNKYEAKLKKAAVDRALDRIEAAADKVVQRYIKFAMKDPATCRHFMDKLLPDQFDMVVPSGASFTVTVRRKIIDQRVPTKEPKRRPRIIKV